MSDFHFQELPPLSLYVHIPWCVRKCPYCDFNSHAVRDELPEREYVDALLQDLDADLEAVQGRSLTSIFFGGGTPSLFSAEALDRLLQGVQARVPFHNEIEITLEANPGTFEQDKFRGFRQAGINRLSIGIQSFQDTQLRHLGRIHSGTEAQRAIEQARAAGFDNFNLDLMHGLPNQTPEQALDDLKIALSHGPQHLSWYQLTIEPNTEFYSRPPQLPEDDILWEIQEQGQALLAARGLHQYEVSAYARPGREARHNLNYWEFGDYLGIGAGAHGKITWRERQEVIRSWKTRNPSHYLSRLGQYRAGQEAIAPVDMPFEFLMNALRLTAGVDEGLYVQRAGLPLSTLEPMLSESRQRGWMDPSRLQTTAQGFRYLNEVLAQFISD